MYFILHCSTTFFQFSRNKIAILGRRLRSRDANDLPVPMAVLHNISLQVRFIVTGNTAFFLMLFRPSMARAALLYFLLFHCSYVMFTWCTLNFATGRNVWFTLQVRFALIYLSAPPKWGGVDWSPPLDGHTNYRRGHSRTHISILGKRESYLRGYPS